MEKGHHSKVKSKAMHKLSLDKISEELISNGNPRKLFKLFEQIGKGGFGAVYSAKRIEDKRQFAIKRVPHYTKKEKWSNLDEIHFLKLSSSRSIVKYYQSFISRDELWVSFYFPFSFSFSPSPFLLFGLLLLLFFPSSPFPLPSPIMLLPSLPIPCLSKLCHHPLPSMPIPPQSIYIFPIFRYQ